MKSIRLLPFLLMLSCTAMASPQNHTCQGGNNICGIEKEGAAGKADITSTDINIDRSHRMSAAGAADLYISACQTGASGQGRSLGFSLASDSGLCDSLKMARYHRAAMNECRTLECRVEHQELEWHFLELAGRIVDQTTTTSIWGKISTNVTMIIMPILLVIALI